MHKGNLLLAAVIGGWIWSGQVGADFNKATTAGKDFAKSMSGTVESTAKSVDPQNVPGYKGENVPETNYYGLGLNIENKAHEEAASNPTAQYFNKARTDRPQFEVNPTSDPLFRRHEEISSKAHGLSETYAGCVDLPVGDKDVTKYKEEICTVTGHQDEINFTCTRNLDLMCTNSDAGTPNPFQDSDFYYGGAAGMTWGSSGHVFWYGNKSANNRTGNCDDYENYIQFYVDDLNNIPEFVLEEVAYDDWLFIWVNGEVAFQGIGASRYAGFEHGWKFTGTYKCEQSAIRTYTINVDAKPKLKVGWNTIAIRNTVGGGGNAYLKFRARRNHGCTVASSYSYVCPAGETREKATLKNSVCISGPETRYIKGFPVYRSCWAWKQDYTRLSDPYFVKDAACGALEAAGCGQTASVCTKHNGVFCESQTLTYSCPYVESARHVSLCGSQLVCPDGGCTADIGQTYTPATEDFKKAATGLAVADEIAKEFDHEKLTVFTGTKMACEKKALGYADCCKSNGWGTDVGLDKCSTEEKQLGLLRQAGRAHFVGDYCDRKDPFGGCLDRRYVYCTYPSKLARIVIEQGKAQLGQGYGSAKSPNCQGFSLTELESLNFDQMDLSEFYSDVMNKAANGTTPTSGDAVKSIQDKLKARYPELEGGN